MVETPRPSLGARFQATTSDATPRSVFVMLWLAAIISHYDERMAWHAAAASLLAGGPLVEALPLVGTLAAYAGLVLARSRLVVATALVLQLLVFAIDLPRTANHWLIASAVSVALLGALAAEARRPGARRPGRDLEGLAPGLAAARLVTVLVYALAVLHKTNSDYLDLVDSCTMHFYRQSRLVPWFPTLPETPPAWAAALLVHGVHLLQLAIPVLLSIRRTWFWGLVAGFLFHMMTALIMRDFPTVMFALQFLFIPGEVQERLCRRLDTLLRGVTRGVMGLAGAIGLQALVWSLWSLGGLEHPQPVVPGEPVADGVFWGWLRAWNVLVVAAFVFFATFVLSRRLDRWRRPDLFHTRRLAFHLVPLVFFVNGMTPYLGFKDTGAMNMYSNLRVYEENWNHLFPPLERLKVFPYVDRGVQPTDPWLVRKLARTRYQEYREHGECR